VEGALKENFKGGAFEKFNSKEEINQKYLIQLALSISTLELSEDEKKSISSIEAKISEKIEQLNTVEFKNILKILSTQKCANRLLNHKMQTKFLQFLSDWSLSSIGETLVPLLDLVDNEDYFKFSLNLIKELRKQYKSSMKLEEHSAGVERETEFLRQIVGSQLKSKFKNMNISEEVFFGQIRDLCKWKEGVTCMNWRENFKSELEMIRDQKYNLDADSYLLVYLLL